MSEFVFLGIIIGANASLLAFGARIVGEERAQYHARLSAMSRGYRRQPFGEAIRPSRG